MINCALVGKGYWGSKLQHYVNGNPFFKLTLVCDSTSNKEQLWNNRDIEAVIVATPNDTHYDIVKAALLSGKHVLAEKPLALEVEQCRELESIAAQKSLVLQVEYTYTCSRALQTAQKLVSEGEIGPILGIEMAVRHLGRFKGGSVYWLLGSHMLAVLDMFIPLKELHFVRTDLVTYEGQVETGIISFNKTGLSGQIIVSLNYPGKDTRIMIYGETGSIIYNPISQPSLIVENYERIAWTIGSKLPKKYREFRIDESDNLRYALQYFADCITGTAAGNVNRAVQITGIIENLHSRLEM